MVGVRVLVKVFVGPGVQVGPQGGNCTPVIPKTPVIPAAAGATNEQAVTGPKVTESFLTSVRIKL